MFDKYLKVTQDGRMETLSSSDSSSLTVNWYDELLSATQGTLREMRKIANDDLISLLALPPSVAASQIKEVDSRIAEVAGRLVEEVANLMPSLTDLPGGYNKYNLSQITLNSEFDQDKVLLDLAHSRLSPMGEPSATSRKFHVPSLRLQRLQHAVN